MPENSGSLEDVDEEVVDVDEDDDEYYEPWELSVISKIPSLPWEIQLDIYSQCDIPTRAALCRVSKHFNERITPLLWRHLDFPEAFGEDDEELVEVTRRFFAACDVLIDENPSRFDALASHVRALDVGRLHGVNVVRRGEEGGYGCGSYVFYQDHGWEDEREGRGRRRNVFDVISRFGSLESLALYVKNWWGFTELRAAGEALAAGLTRIKSLALGGQMSADVLDGLLDAPERLEHLTLVNLHCSPGQDDGPNGISFIAGLLDSGRRFARLESLHLCKLADLDGHLSDDGQGDDGDEDERREYASGMRWRFPRESEVDVLEDWAALLRCTSATLRSLTLENRFLCSGGGFERTDDFVIDPGGAHPAHYGAFSIRESQRRLFPELSGREWPRLEELVLVGMGAAEDVDRAVAHLAPRVRVEKRLATIEIMAGDATPEQVSTPIEFGGLRWSREAVWPFPISKICTDRAVHNPDLQIKATHQALLVQTHHNSWEV